MLGAPGDEQYFAPTQRNIFRNGIYGLFPWHRDVPVMLLAQRHDAHMPIQLKPSLRGVPENERLVSLARLFCVTANRFIITA